jgi:hypothetical protein
MIIFAFPNPPKLYISGDSPPRKQELYGQIGQAVVIDAKINAQLRIFLLDSIHKPYLSGRNVENPAIRDECQ